MKLPQTIHLFAAANWLSVTAVCQLTAEEICGNLGVLKLTDEELATVPDKSALRMCADHPLGRNRTLDANAGASLAPWTKHLPDRNTALGWKHPTAALMVIVGPAVDRNAGSGAGQRQISTIIEILVAAETAFDLGLQHPDAGDWQKNPGTFGLSRPHQLVRFASSESSLAPSLVLRAKTLTAEHNELQKALNDSFDAVKAKRAGELLEAMAGAARIQEGVLVCQ
ncbi:hypothetical protein NLG97_g5345 [Lecanicillium saksenae]|uniref:Uncharacterized protein n=1 Tax=Lecanicillium saksenae TaxID=468837 RepID=A0ACC1QSW6_9HYPO|nr:hypothetical protein NLG97_g5345 [Lecanicillium saksenae]